MPINNLYIQAPYVQVSQIHTIYHMIHILMSLRVQCTLGEPVGKLDLKQDQIKETRDWSSDLTLGLM